MHPWLSEPRIFFWPMSLALLIDMALHEFPDQNSAKFRAENYWRGLVRRQEALVLRPFYEKCVEVIRDSGEKIRLWLKLFMSASLSGGYHREPLHPHQYRARSTHQRIWLRQWCAALGDTPGASWLEPSHGSGAFVQAIARSGAGNDRIVAVDLDPATAAADRLATTLRGVDFLQWATETDRRFDRIVGNPPFISISQLSPSLQKTAASVMDLDGRPIGKGANLWYAFVLASLRLLRKSGCLSFILPSAAEFADYCSAVRRGVGEVVWQIRTLPMHAATL